MSLNSVTYNYKNDNYAKVEGLNSWEIFLLLRKTYYDYRDDWRDVGFFGMVEAFAKDDFYHHHYIAQEYLRIKKLRENA